MWVNYRSYIDKGVVPILRTKVNIRTARLDDLSAINAIIESAVMSWKIPDRVKRLSLPSYCYYEIDFQHLEIVVAEDHRQNIIGLAAWEQADSADAPVEQAALLLHGIYVDASHHHQGVGRQLLRAAEAVVVENKSSFDGLLVKAQADAIGFFTLLGMKRLAVEDSARDYEHRFWKSTDQIDCEHKASSS